VYNGRFTGISFSDFVTGENPSFKVSFTDDEEQNKNVNFSLSCEELDSKMNLTLTADKPVVVRNTDIPDNYQYTPYLIDSEGSKLMLDIKSDNDSPYSFKLSYNKPEPTVQPMTEYTLVIPEGLFRTGYNQTVPAYTTTLKTPQFLSLTVIGKIPDDADNKVHSKFRTAARANAPLLSIIITGIRSVIPSLSCRPCSRPTVRAAQESTPAMYIASTTETSLSICRCRTAAAL